MRLAPVPMYFAGDEDRAADFSARSCVTTHRAAECLDVARLLGRVLARALPGHDQEALLLGIDTSGLTPGIARLRAWTSFGNVKTTSTAAATSCIASKPHCGHLLAASAEGVTT
jgi:hypothetical protein